MVSSPKPHIQLVSYKAELRPSIRQRESQRAVWKSFFHAASDREDLSFYSRPTTRVRVALLQISARENVGGKRRWNRIFNTSATATRTHACSFVKMSVYDRSVNRPCSSLFVFPFCHLREREHHYQAHIYDNLSTENKGKNGRCLGETGRTVHLLNTTALCRREEGSRGAYWSTAEGRGRIQDTRLWQTLVRPSFGREGWSNLAPEKRLALTYFLACDAR